MKSFLEDPWAGLVKKLNKSEDAKGGELSKIEQSLSPQSVYHITSKENSESKSDFYDSCLSQESKNGSSVDGTLGLDDTDVSDLSKTDSSINLKLESVNFSKESETENICSNIACEETQEGNSIREFCATETGSIKAII